MSHPRRSWSPRLLIIKAQKRWGRYIHEPWASAEKTIQVDTGADFNLCASELRTTVLAKIRSALAANPRVRTQASTLVAPNTEFPKVINLFQLLWDGLRTLPYSDDDLTTAMANVAFLAASWINSFEKEDQSPVVAAHCGDVIAETADGRIRHSAAMQWPRATSMRTGCWEHCALAFPSC